MELIEKLTITATNDCLVFINQHLNNVIYHFLVTDLKTKTKQLIIKVALNDDYLPIKRSIYQVIASVPNLENQNLKIDTKLLSKI